MVKFSVIVPVYNNERYLRDCLDSIINQSYKNIEIICIDDGSTDSSGHILDEYSMRDKRLVVLHKSNTGYGNSMNIGMEMATGDYVGIVESDDYIAFDMFERIAIDIKKAGCVLDVVKYSYTRFDDKEYVHRKLFDENMCNKIFSPVETKYIDLFRTQCCVWSAVYSRNFLERNSIRFLETQGASYQDTGFSFKVWITAKTVLLKNDAVYFYRCDNMDSSINSDKKVFCVCDEIKEIDTYLVNKGIATEFICNARYVFMFQTYWWNYNRLHGRAAYAFYIQMAEELRVMSENPHLDYNYFEEPDRHIVQGIISEPEDFFKKINPWFDKYLMEGLLDKYTLSGDIYREGLKQYLMQCKQLVIYGAGVYGKNLFEFLKKKGYQDKVYGFAVTDSSNEPKSIEGIPVYGISDLEDSCMCMTIIVSVKADKQLGILKKLKRMGFNNVIRMDSVFAKLVNETNKGINPF